MKDRNKEERLPTVAHDTIRQQLISLLAEHTLSARELSARIRISEKEVYDHLEHVRMSGHRGFRLRVSAAQCRKCGFEFSKRERLKKPGKCPVCRSESIRDPQFSLEHSDAMR